MTQPSGSELTEKIIAKAKSLGATLAGVADIESLKSSPSHEIYPKIGMNLEVHWQGAQDDVTGEAFIWPPDARSAVVIGVSHPVDQPELDWWDGKGTAGNRILIKINRQLSEWIEATFSVKTYKLPYFVEKGGIFLKDAAVMAGLGCIGQNNLVITPEFGPRIRFRTLLLNREAAATGPIPFNPCKDCKQPCRKACPVKAFQHTVFSADAIGQSRLPGINGTYDRVTCNVKMEKDIEEAVTAVPADDDTHREMRMAVNKFEEGDNETNYCVKYCRHCELACPVGK